MEEIRVRIMFEREMETRVKRMTKIGPDLWSVETVEGETFEVRSYNGQPLSED